MQAAGLLNALEAELAGQVEESFRPPFETEKAVGDPIDFADSKTTDSSTLKTGSCQITDKQKLVWLNLTDSDEVSNFQHIMAAHDELNTKLRLRWLSWDAVEA
ncbi:hypothetical protein PI124_g14947 [Phytophthora idaei]|nr:hypothetical protein PI125_g21772 [Phytophthora idaei]KAG3144831.1 hypothetical protein PI126_g13982 [Phytophthora idaei]KAG3240148.1 hypothetical protein PI124_g14947 [Phytophthora idaei]